jgi:hypothetical protein
MLRLSANQSKSRVNKVFVSIVRRFGIKDRRASFMLEFAMVAPVFFLLLFVVFEVSYDLFMQEVLDNALQSTARLVQIGMTQSATSSNFVSTYFCPNANGLLDCQNLFIRIQQVTFTPGSCTNLNNAAIGDYYDATDGHTPISGGVLQLGDYYNGAGVAGTGSNVGLSPCGSSNSSNGFCDAGSSEMMLMTAVYVAPSFLDGLVLNTVKYNGQYVRAQTSTAAFITEPFALLSPPKPC